MTEHELTPGELAERAGVAISALHFYEREGLIASRRTAGNQRRYARDTLRRVAFIRMSQRVGIPLARVREALATLPAGRVPTSRDWARLSAGWRDDLEERILHLQRLRDNPACADSEFAELLNPQAGLFAKTTFDVAEDIAAPFIATGARPRLAVLREQGVNGQIEMAAAFDRAGFEAVDVHMSDIISGRVALSDFTGLAACGGFSYGDVLGAGEGWAKSILFNTAARDQFEGFFARSDVFALGVCNGCQMMSNLSGIIPGAAHWPAWANRARP